MDLRYGHVAKTTWALALAGCSPSVTPGAGSSDTSGAPASSATTTLTTSAVDESSTSSTTSADVTTASPTDTSTSSSSSSSSDDGTVGETTANPTGDCSDNLVVDGGFEAGTPSQAWTEMSENFGTPICDDGCSGEGGPAPYAGTWFVWLGGLADPETASVGQAVVIDGPTAFLGFHLDIDTAAGTGDDVFEVTLDDTSLFMVTDADMAAYDGYTPISIDISEFADGAAHTIVFSGVFPGTGLSNFYLDEISLVTCTVEDTTGTGVDTDASSGGSSESTGGSST